MTEPTTSLPLPRSYPLGMSRARRAAAIVWATLSPVGRVALAGILVSALVALALGAYIPLEIRRHLLTAGGRGLEAAVVAITPLLPHLDSGPLNADEIARLDRIVDRALLDADHVRVKLWSLDGVIVYSDASEAIGRRFGDVVPRLAEVVEHGVVAVVTDLRDPENASESGYSRLVEYYVPVMDDAGRTIAVFEIYEDVRFLEEALGGITTATWLAIGSGLAILLVFLVLLVAAAVRSISRDRAAAETRAAELAILVEAAEALASSLEPSEFLARLDALVRRTLGLSRFSREPTTPAEPGVLGVPLRDGSWLVAGRSEPPLDADDERVLRSVADSLDAALANATLFAEVRDAAQERRRLLRRVVEAHEDERHHIVGELHDTLAAELIRTLYGIRGIAARRADLSADIVAEVDGLERLVESAERDLRAFMGRVRPVALDTFGLSAALEESVHRFRSEARIDAELQVTGQPERASPGLQLVVLRTVEEALLNVRKHAAATRVRVAVRLTAGKLRVAIDDDGVGWRREEEAPVGRELGLAYLRERIGAFGGVLRTERSSLGGAGLVVEIPLEA